MARRRSKKRERLRRARLRAWGITLLFLLTLFLLWQRAGGDSQPYVTSEEEALARVIRSEIGIGTAKQQLHIAWAVRNLAKERKQSIARMACSPCGAQGRKRPVASGQAALDSDRRLARKVLSASQHADPTGGASHFLNPKLQDVLAKSGKLPGYRGNTYRKVARKWRKSYGWEPYYRLSPTLEMWGQRRAKKAARGKRLN